MSLFKVRDWWSTTCGPDEHFDQGSLCVANIDNHSNGIDKVIVGSQEGVLRIYGPNAVLQDDGTMCEFKPDDMLLETQLMQPILQLEPGRLSGVKENLSLAVLHPRKVSVYSVAAISGAVEHGTHYHLSLLYEHNLRRSAFCMIVGGFGSVKRQDFICVQSLDGTLSFFEQESFAFSRFLPTFLLPGPLKYIARTDSIVTVSSAWQVEAYKYQVLAVATDSGSKEESQNMTTGKRVVADWTFTLGESASDLQVIQTRRLVFILGARNIFCLKDTGGVLFVKSLEYSPSCFLPYMVSEGDPFMMVASCGQNLHVYQQTDLRWAAQIPFVPVVVQKANVQDLKGVVVLLSEGGELCCSYLGTNPALFVPPAVDAREVNYSETDREMAELQRVIKASQKANFMPQNKNNANLSLNVNVAKTFDMMHVANLPDAEPVPSVSVQIQLKCATQLHSVRLTVDVEKPLAVTHSVFTFPTVSDSIQVVVSVYSKEHFLPSALEAQAVATYTTVTGVPQVVMAPIILPLRLILHPCVPLKEAQHKITITTNRPAVNLIDLFPDVAGDDRTSSTQAMGFEYYVGPVVTMLAAKTSQRYRLQSDSFPAMWIVTSELIRRLRQWIARTGRESDLIVSFASNMPLNELFEVIDHHFQMRLESERIQQLLSERATQFRAVQKRLLTKYKDKTPTPLENFDMLLEGTYQQILTMMEVAEENEHQLAEAACNVSCAVRLTLLLLRLLAGLAQAEDEVLQAVFCLSADNNMDQGWEEVVDAGLTHLLRTTLAKPGKDQAPMPASMKMPKDTTRLKKHIALVVDRLGKGSHVLAKDGSAPKGEDTVQPQPPTPMEPDEDGIIDDVSTTDDADDDDDEPDSSHVPIGSQFGDRVASARMRSARLRQEQKVEPVEDLKAVHVAGVSDIPQDSLPDIVSNSTASEAEEDILEF